MIAQVASHLQIKIRTKAVNFKSRVVEACQNRFEKVRKIRRDIHMYPETGFDLERTATIVAEELEKLGIRARKGIGKSGVVGDIRVSDSAKTVALRADMDALDIRELNDVPYKSRIEGKGHMCGHDVHTATLVGTAGVIWSLRSELKANVRFIFQPSEEKPPGGAIAMIEDGVLEGVDEIYGLHVIPRLETGHFGIGTGAFMAQVDSFEIRIAGKGGHAAFPHLTIDPVVVGCKFVADLQSIVSRNIDPFGAAVVSVTQFHAGTAFNIIPESANIAGTVRTMDETVQQKIRRKMEDLLNGAAAAHGIDFDFNYIEEYPVTRNHPECEKKAVRVAETLAGPGNVAYPYPPILGGEDFGYYTAKVPGCLIWLGCGNTEKGITHMCHHPCFDVDETCMAGGMALLAGCVFHNDPQVFE